MGKTFEFSDYRDAITSGLVAAFDRFPEELGVESSTAVTTAFERLREYSLRSSKRIRGSLAAAAYDEAGEMHLGQPGLQLGVALELIQSYLLIIDDVMDRSALRRGKPTVHELYLQQPDPRVGLHEAQMMAVNVGELAQHMANLILAAVAAPDAALRQVMQLMHANIMITGVGQIDDIYQQIGRTVSEADIMRKYRNKSSYYTFVNPMQCGFALAGKGTAETLHRCQEFGVPSGVAFQLHDDILGIFGDPKVLGKPNLDDIREGKYTLVIAYALEHAAAADNKRLKRILGDDKANERDLMIVRDIVDRSGAKAYVVSAIAQAAGAAEQVLKTAGWSKEFSALLQELVEFSTVRQS